MVKPLICVPLTRLEDIDKVCAGDLIEVRIDMLGSRWSDVVNSLCRPWIACNRRADEGGYWIGDEASRINELARAVNLGATFVDIELQTPNIEELIKYFKSRGVRVIVSKHITTHTPDLQTLKSLVKKMIDLGADVWKIATKACSHYDNVVLLKLLKEFEVPGISIAMGDLGTVSRILSPLVGGFLTYASACRGAESAPGQLTVSEIKEIYSMLGVSS
ncbi:MAG: type I 3-dehydroquinate dehydratase [Sulfolobales archaeon]